MVNPEIKDTQELSKLLFNAPDPLVSIYLMTLISFFSGVFTELAIRKTTTLETGIILSLIYGGVFGFFIFAVPAVLSASITQTICKLFRAEISQKRAYFLSLSALIVAELIYVPGTILSMTIGVDNPFLYSFLLSLSGVLVFRTFVLRTITGIKPHIGLVPGSVQSTLMLSNLILARSIEVYTDPMILGEFTGYFLLTKVVISSLILIFALHSIILIIEAPLKKNLNTGLLDLVNYIFANIEKESPLLEGVFDVYSEKIKLPISVISIKAQDKTKALVLSSFIHPGPFGRLGSSDMPANLIKAFSQKTGAHVFFTKGAGTHDTNLVSSKDISQVRDAYSLLLNRLEYTNKATEFKRIGETPSIFSIGFGASTLAISTFSPMTTEDIEIGVGFTILSEMKQHTKNPIFIESHNSFEEPISPIYSGSEDALNLISEISLMTKTISEQPSYKIKAGAAKTCIGLGINEGMGSEGIGMLLFEINKTRYALVFADSNNIAKGIREKIIERLKQKGITDAEIISSDTHSVNTVNGGENPLCARSGMNELLAAIDTLYSRSLDDLEEVEIAGIQDLVEANVFGAGKSSRLFSTISAVSAISKILAPALLSLAFILWLFTYFFSRGFV